MNHLTEKIQLVAKNAEKLCNMLELERLENKNLKREATDLKKQLEFEKKSNEELNNKLKLLKLAKSIGNTDTTEKTVVKRKINEFIREIDKCIALLNS